MSTLEAPRLAQKKQYLIPWQNFKNLLRNFFGINIRGLYAKFQVCSFKTEGFMLLLEAPAFFNFQKMYIYLILINSLNVFHPNKNSF